MSHPMPNGCLLPDGPASGVNQQLGRSARRAIHFHNESLIAAADPTHYPIAPVDPCSGGRLRPACPKPVEFGVLAPAYPERRVGFVLGALVGKVDTCPS